MSKHAAPSRRSPWTPLAVVVLAGAVLVSSGAGVFAILKAVATGSQAVTTGTLALTAAGNGTFGTSIGGLAPGDLVHRFVTVTNSGSLAGTGLTLAVSGTGSTELTTGGTTALRVSVTECSVAWVPTGSTGGVSEGSCSGTTTSTTVSGSSVPVPTTALPAGPIAAGGARYLRLSIRVPDIGEVSTDGAPPSTTVQGKTASLTFTFTEDQRAGTVSSS